MMERYIGYEGEHITVAAIITDKAGCRCDSVMNPTHYKYEIELPTMRHSNMSTRLWICGSDLGKSWSDIEESRES